MHYCEKCSDDYTKCSKCYNGYGLETNENNELTGGCISCDSLCDTCYGNSDYCILCSFRTGLVRDSEGNSMNTCKECLDEYCNDCLDDYTKCNKCYTGNGLDSDGKCQFCTVNNCYECYKDYNSCEMCSNSYGVSINENNEVEENNNESHNNNNRREGQNSYIKPVNFYLKEETV